VFSAALYFIFDGKLRNIAARTITFHLYLKSENCHYLILPLDIFFTKIHTAW